MPRSRPRRDIAPSGEPDLFVLLGVSDDLLKRVDQGDPRDEIGVRDHVDHGGILAPDPVPVIEFIFKFLKKLLARPALLYSVIIARVLVRKLDDGLVAHLYRVGHFIVMVITV